MSDEQPETGFPTYLVDSIAKAVGLSMESAAHDIAAAVKAWRDIPGLVDHIARIQVADRPGALAHLEFEGDGRLLAAMGPDARTILLADSRHYGTAEPGQVNVDRHERKYAGRTYSVALLHRDEAAKIPADPKQAPEPDDEAPERVEPPEGADEFVRLCNRLYFDLDEITGGPLHVSLEDENLHFMLGEYADRDIAVFTAALAIIDSGHLPDSGRLPIDPSSDDLAADAAYYYGVYDGDRREALQCAIDILNVCKGWTEAQLETVYKPWAREVYGNGGPIQAKRRYLARRADEA